MGAHSLGQFHHFNIPTRTRLKMEMDAENRRRAWIRRHREEGPVKEAVVERPGWWVRLWSWMKRIAKGAE